MKKATLSIGLLAGALLIGGLLTVSMAHVKKGCPANCHATKLGQDGKGDHANDHGAAPQAPRDADAPNKEIKLQTTCPVMGGAIDKNQYVDHDGKRVYICCKGCEAPLKKDPAKYIQKLEAEGVTVAKLQTECPVMGGAIDKALYVDHGGKRIYVCCQGCVAMVTKEFAKYVKAMEEAGVALHAADEDGKAVEPKKPAAGHEGHQH